MERTQGNTVYGRYDMVGNNLQLYDAASYKRSVCKANGNVLYSLVFAVQLGHEVVHRDELDHKDINELHGRVGDCPG